MLVTTPERDVAEGLYSLEVTNVVGDEQGASAPGGAGDEGVADDALNLRVRETRGAPAAAGLQTAEEGIKCLPSEPSVFVLRHEERALILVGAHGSLP